MTLQYSSSHCVYRTNTALNLLFALKCVFTDTNNTWGDTRGGGWGDFVPRGKKEDKGGRGKNRKAFFQVNKIEEEGEFNNVHPLQSV